MEKLYTLKEAKKLLGVTTNSHRCSMCGMVNAPKGALYECECRLRIDRQLNGAINLYLKMEIAPHEKNWWDRNILPTLMGGYFLTGAEQNGTDELVK